MKQIIPCNVKMYAVYEEKGKEFKDRVLAFGIDDLGYPSVLVFDCMAGLVDDPAECDNFVRYEIEE